jgi:branched-chain amino acid transport system permease protein
VPPFLGSFHVGLLTLIVIWGLFAMSLDVLLGYGGLPSLGHSAFFGVGAYATALTAVHTGWGFGGALAAVVVSCALVGAVMATFALRSRGVYFLMVTLAISQVLWGIAFGWRSVTRGDDGITDIARPSLGGFIDLSQPLVFFYFALAWLVSIWAFLALVMRSPFGLVFSAAHQAESRVRAFGFDIWGYRFIAFVIAGIAAGIAGMLQAYLDRFVGPDHLGLVPSVEALLMVLLGGAGTLVGAVIGAAAFVFLKHLVGGYVTHWEVLLGIIYIVVALWNPRGLAVLGGRAVKDTA